MKSRARSDRVIGRTPLSAPLIVVEHLEPYTSRWMFYELRHAAILVGDGKLLVTNVKRTCEVELLGEFCRVEKASIVELTPKLDIPIIVLDPSARVRLSPRDFAEPVAVVVGGIMGSHPPGGRTRSLLTVKLEKHGAVARSLGEGQFTIDGAVYMALRVSQGVELEEIPVQRGLRLDLPGGGVVELPFTYPVVDGVPLISREETEYLVFGVEEDEEVFAKTGRPPAIC